MVSMWMQKTHPVQRAETKRAGRVKVAGPFCLMENPTFYIPGQFAYTAPTRPHR